MYAYKSNVEYGYGYGNSQITEKPRYTNITSPIVKRQVKRKKQHSLMSSLSILAIIAVFIGLVLPFSFHCVKNIFFSSAISPYTTKTNTPIISNNFYYNSKVNIENILYPTRGYICNDMFLNQRLLAAPYSQKKTVSDMYMSEELVDLETQLKGLGKAYSNIQPSVFVWSFETGKYAAINSEKVYPAASIIKIPVLVQLFKSIEAGQVTIYDEMTLTHPFRASGSGDLQYASEGRNYTLDDLARVMIQDSDNSATNMLMSKIGGVDDVNSAIKSWGLKNTHINTWLPDLTGTNTTTAYDLAKILYNLENPSFLNINSREDIVKYMSKVKNNRLIQAGLPQGVPFVHKTGDIGKMLGDAGIVYMPSGQHYVVVILAKRPHNHHDGVEFIQKASSLIYSYMQNVR